MNESQTDDKRERQVEVEIAIGESSAPGHLNSRPTYENCRHNSTADRAKDRYPGVAPIRAALSGNRQKRVGQPRSKITGRINCIPGGGAEGKPHTPNHAPNERGP